MKKSNKKLQLRVQTFEKKLELQHVKEERITSLYEKTNEEFEQTKIERDTYLTLVYYKLKINLSFSLFIFIQAKTKEDEMNKTQTRFINEAEKIAQLEENLENYKNKTKDRINEAQEGYDI